MKHYIDTDKYVYTYVFVCIYLCMYLDMCVLFCKRSRILGSEAQQKSGCLMNHRHLSVVS